MTTLREQDVARRRAAAVERVRRELEDRLQARLDAGLCGCPCGKPFPNRPKRKLYLNERHRDSAYRERLKALAKAQDVPLRQTLKTLDTTSDTAERRADAQTARKRPRRAPRPGVSIYLPSVDVADRLRRLLDVEGTIAGRRAHELGRAAYLSGAIAAAPARARAYIEALEAAYAERLAGELDPAREAIGKALTRRHRRDTT